MNTAGHESASIPELINTEQLARKLGLKPNTLAQWRLAGSGPQYVKIGRRVRYRVTDVQGWITAQNRQSTAASGAVTR
jgi:predicted DNA-binding transcriptional regulator AlpA